MEDRRFDALVRSLAAAQGRRAFLKGMLGLGGAAVVGAAMLPNDVDAARRGFSGPKLPTPCAPMCAGSVCGGDGCGGVCGDCLGGQTCFEGVCFNSCDPNGEPGCCTACECDAINFVCVSQDNVGTNCAETGCPVGSFCDQSDTCKTACACGA